MIRKEYLDKFKKLYKDKYEITLSDEEATDLATHFLNLMEILIKPKAKRKVVNINTYKEVSSQAANYENHGL